MRIEKLGWRGRLPYVLVAVAVALMLSITAVQAASAQTAAAEAQKINGCYNKQTGQLRVLKRLV